MEKYLKIQPVNLGGLETNKIANAIFWRCFEIERGATSANLMCSLHNVSIEQYIDPQDNQEKTREVSSVAFEGFSMFVPNEVLQAWGDDDSVIDDLVLTYSSKFIKA